MIMRPRGNFHITELHGMGIADRAERSQVSHSRYLGTESPSPMTQEPCPEPRQDDAIIMRFWLACDSPATSPDEGETDAGESWM
jgi:hypothetical protein